MAKMVINPWGKIKSFSAHTRSNNYKAYVEYHEGEYCSGFRIPKTYFEKLPELVKQYRAAFEFNKTFWFSDLEAPILKKYLVEFPEDQLNNIKDLDKVVDDLLKPGNWIDMKHRAIRKSRLKRKNKKARRK